MCFVFVMNGDRIKHSCGFMDFNTSGILEVLTLWKELNPIMSIDVSQWGTLITPPSNIVPV